MKYAIKEITGIFIIDKETNEKVLKDVDFKPIPVDQWEEGKDGKTFVHIDLEKIEKK